jgi:hypothetical protein
MLGVHGYEVEQFRGDDITGLYRCRNGVMPRGVDPPEGVEVVAYSWGALTSGASGALGAVRRALWLTLLPFALGNLAYWARPELDTVGRTRVATAIAVRQACLLLTLLLTAAMCFIGIDMVAWQCFRGGTAVCPALPSQLGFLGSSPWDAAGVRMLLGSLLPLGVLGLLWWLSATSLARYEAQEASICASGDMGVLTKRRMWAGDVRSRRLQRLHIGAGLLLVVMFGLVPAMRYSERAGAWWMAVTVVGLAAALLVLTAVAVGVSYRDGIDFPGVHAGFADRLARVLPWLAVTTVVLYAVVMVLIDIPERFDDPGLIVGRNILIGGLILALIAVVSWLLFATEAPGWALLAPLSLAVVAFVSALSVPAALIVAGVVLAVLAVLQSRRSDRPDRPRAWRGAGPAMILGAAVWVAALFTTSLVVFVGNWLNGSQTVTQLQSEFSVANSPGAFAARVQASEPVLLATGDVLLRHAVLERSGPDFYVLREGTVEASSITTADGDVIRATPNLDISAGLLLVDDPPIQVIDGCIKDPGMDCGTSVDTWLYTLAGPLAVEGPVSISVVAVPQEPIVVPQVLIWFSGLTVVWVLMCALIVALGLLVFTRRSRDAIDAQIRTDQLPEQSENRSGRARRLAGFTHRAERLLAWIALVTSACSVVLVVGSVSGWQPWRAHDAAAALVNVGLWTAVSVSAVLIVAVGKLLNAAGFWRAVGILWDLTTFWPRVAHPLGPPCYAERVVPEIVDEVLGSARGTRVILSGHSQGSLILVAVLSQVASIRGNLDDIRFVSYGSQLRTWYGRIFPAVLGSHVLGNTGMTAPPGLASAAPDAPDTGTAGDRYAHPVPLGTLGAMLAIEAPQPSWVTLFRRTDPIGFRVFGDEGSTVDRYVSEYDPPGKQLHSHSDYQFSSVYTDLMSHWYT